MLLLGHAVRVFASSGFRAARHAEIAEAAAVSVSTVFFYFQTRAALVEAVAAELDSFFGGLVERALTGDAPAPDLLLRLSREFAASVDTHPDHARAWLDWSTAFGDDAWPSYQAFQARVVEMLVATVERGQHAGTLAPDLDPEGEAFLLLGAAYIVVQLKITGRAKADIDRFLLTLVRSTVGRLTVVEPEKPI